MSAAVVRRRSAVARLLPVAIIVGITLIATALCCNGSFRRQALQSEETTLDIAETHQNAEVTISKPQDANLDADQAIALAKKALERDGLNPKRYVASASREGTTWVVTFLGKPPRRPGDLVRVTVAADGTIEDIYRGK